MRCSLWLTRAPVVTRVLFYTCTTWVHECVANSGARVKQDPGDNWTGAANPFGPKIPLGAHGAFGSAPPTASGWSSGECNTNGQAQCGQVCMCACTSSFSLHHSGCLVCVCKWSVFLREKRRDRNAPKKHRKKASAQSVQM